MEDRKKSTTTGLDAAAPCRRCGASHDLVERVVVEDARGNERDVLRYAERVACADVLRSVVERRGTHGVPCAGGLQRQLRSL